MTEEISTQILDAAEARFRTYGFGKTTMAEIASDIDMSTANLYRYFENNERDISVMIKQTGRAVLLTSLTTMAAFGSLA